jgi:putative transposase
VTRDNYPPNHAEVRRASCGVRELACPDEAEGLPLFAAGGLPRRAPRINLHAPLPLCHARQSRGLTAEAGRSVAGKDIVAARPGKPGRQTAAASRRTPHEGLLTISREAYTPAATMTDWPHAPAHCITKAGTYIVTAATHGRAPIFASRQRLNSLCDTLLRLCTENQWSPQAWAVFPNHYHFVAASASPASLPDLIRRLHSITARAVNNADHRSGRQVWFQYWDTLLTNERSYFARLRYVHENAVHHRVVRRAANYSWCSAAWFEREAEPAFRKTVLSFPCDRVSVPDSFAVSVKL